MDLQFCLTVPGGVKFSNTQSLLQIVVALNLAYFTFREVRTPANVLYERAVREWSELIDQASALYNSVDKPEKLIPNDEKTTAWNRSRWFDSHLNVHRYNRRTRTLGSYDQNIYTFDRIFRYWSLVAASIGFVALFFSSILPECYFGIPYLVVFLLIMVLPIFAVIAYHWAIANVIVESTSWTIDQIKLIEHDMKQFTTEVPKQYIKGGSAL
jgi:hypothetical protein